MKLVFTEMQKPALENNHFCSIIIHYSLLSYHKSQGGLSEKLRKLNCAPHTRKSLVKGERFMRCFVWRAWVTLRHVKFKLVWLMYQNQGACSLKIWINALRCQQASTQPISMFSLHSFDIVISVLSCNEDWLWTKNGDSQLHLFNVKWFLIVTIRNLFHIDIELKSFLMDWQDHS